MWTMLSEQEWAMGLQVLFAVAIVMSPNLFSISTDNPMYALTMSQKVADYTFVLLSARLQLSYPQVE